jgi:hypothetical protein
MLAQTGLTGRASEPGVPRCLSAECAAWTSVPNCSVPSTISRERAVGSTPPYCPSDRLTFHWNCNYGATVVTLQRGDWVLLNYRMPREPSTPRIAVWRKVKRLGVAQLGDGLVALPADARTQEQLEWVAGEITEAGGTRYLWRAQLMSGSQQRTLVASLALARAEEYRGIRDRAIKAAEVPGQERERLLRVLRGELRRVHRRDFFPPTERDEARRAVEALVEPFEQAASAEVRSGPS